MSVTISADDPRTIRAIEIAAGADHWLLGHTPDGAPAYVVPSQVSSERSYLVTSASCDCPDFQRRDLAGAASGEVDLERPCKHVLAVRLHIELVRAERQRLRWRR